MSGGTLWVVAGRVAGAVVLTGLVWAVACGDDAGMSDGGGDGAQRGAPASAECATLCEKILGCQQNSPADEVCPWLAAADAQHCRSSCDRDVAASALRADCVACLAAYLGCGGTASVRPCDPACTPTPYVTGDDDEDSTAAYDFRTYYCEGWRAPVGDSPPMPRADAGALPRPSCAALDWCVTSGLCIAPEQCFQLTGCREPVCVTAGRACTIACGDPVCTILESDPLQVSCD